MIVVYAFRNMSMREPYQGYSIEDCDKKSDTDDEKDLCYIKISQETDNFDACLKVKNKEDRDKHCTWSVALGKNDRSICEKIEDNILRYECFQRIGLDMSVCKTLSETEKGYCYTGFADQMSDYRICNNIENLEMKKTCCEKLGEYDQNVKNKCLENK